MRALLAADEKIVKSDITKLLQSVKLREIYRTRRQADYQLDGLLIGWNKIICDVRCYVTASALFILWVNAYLGQTK